MIKGKYKRKAYFFICDMLSIANKCIPKNNKKILFFSHSELADNSKALFDYLLTDPVNEEYEIVCSVSNPQKYERYKRKNVTFVPVLASLYHILTSKYIFFHGEIIAIKPSKKQISTNLWHGTPLKRFNKTADKLRDYRYDFFTYVLASSDNFRPIMRDCFGCELEKVVVLGHPRNDLLFQQTNALQRLNIQKEVYQSIFLWMPTFRISRDNYMVDIESQAQTETGLPIMGHKDDLAMLNDKLREQNSFMIIKLHPAQSLEYITIEKFTNILFLTNDDLQEADVQLYHVVTESGALITDYSSIYFDYLLLNRPIGFTVDDLESYQNARGFLFENPLEYMPGKKISTKDHFWRFIDSIFWKNDDYKQQRENINKFANKYQDDANCARVLQFVGIK